MCLAIVNGRLRIRIARMHGCAYRSRECIVPYRADCPRRSLPPETTVKSMIFDLFDGDGPLLLSIMASCFAMSDAELVFDLRIQWKTTAVSVLDWDYVLQASVLCFRKTLTIQKNSAACMECVCARLQLMIYLLRLWLLSSRSSVPRLLSVL